VLLGGETLSSEEQPKPSLRERKKAKTRAAIQQHALRLFREQGYHATTVEQIAEAAEVSPSTFFRYFPTKESVVLEDDYDPLLIEAFKKQPDELSSIQALRNAMKEVFANLSDAEHQALRERMELWMAIPELRAAALNHFTENASMIAKLVAERTGREINDPLVLAFTGSVLGIAVSVRYFCAQNPDADFMAVYDEALAHLEKGFSQV